MKAFRNKFVCVKLLPVGESIVSGKVVVARTKNGSCFQNMFLWFRAVCFQCKFTCFSSCNRSAVLLSNNNKNNNNKNNNNNNNSTLICVRNKKEIWKALFTSETYKVACRTSTFYIASVTWRLRLLMMELVVVVVAEQHLVFDCFLLCHVFSIARKIQSFCCLKTEVRRARSEKSLDNQYKKSIKKWRHLE